MLCYNHYHKKMSGISLRIQLRKIINRLLELQIAEESDTS